ncbi:MAG TPA: energy transducer TonB [Polyangia bacterium]|nr:energy transducer TonB [Polyangia bacterium]
MTVDRPIVVCIALSVAAHVVFARGMQHLPRRPDLLSPRKIAIRVIAPPPPAEPPPEPAKAAPAPAEPKPVAHERARARPQAAANPQPPRESPPPQPSPSPGDNTGMPVFGVSMESTSQAGQGPAMPIGGPSGPAFAGGGPRMPAKGAEGGPPVPEYEVTTMPLPQGRCVGKYTDEAREAAVEGTVVLEVVVGADGRPRDIHVVSGLGHGLTEAAIAALKACRFSPGQKNGLAVPVRLREFKIRFLQNDQNE